MSALQWQRHEGGKNCTVDKNLLALPAGSPSCNGNVIVHVFWHKLAELVHSFLLCSWHLFLSLWPFQLYFVLLTTISFLALFFQSYFCLLSPFKYILCLKVLNGDPQWGTRMRRLDPSVLENPKLIDSPFKAWSRSICGHACYAYCQGFLANFYPPDPITHIFSKTSFKFFLCWLWLTPLAVWAHKIK